MKRMDMERSCCSVLELGIIKYSNINLIFFIQRLKFYAKTGGEGDMDLKKRNEMD